MNFTDKDILIIDFETYYHTKAGYGLRDMSITEYIRNEQFKVQGLAYNWLHEGITHWLSGDHTIQAWMHAIDWRRTVIVAHNVRFDGSIMAWRYQVTPYAWFDTIALAKAVLGENVSSFGLKSLGRYLGLQDKGELKWDGVRDLTLQQEQEMAVYCKGDVDICKGIYEKLIGQFPMSQLQVLDWTIRAFVYPRLMLDVQILEHGVQTEKARREEAIKASGVEKAILSSNKQFAELLESRGIAVPTKTSGRTGKAIPAFARTDGGLEELGRTQPCLYAARIASKANLLETRGQSLLRVAKTGTFPFDIGFSGAIQTHRFSGGSGAGGNPQNFTRKSFLRSAVSAPAGWRLVVGDFAAIELRILAWLAKEPKLMNSIINNNDIYSEFASAFFGRPVPAKESTPERHFGKAAILGLGYGMGGVKFQATVKTQLKQEISDAQAQKTVRFYRGNYFNVPKLWEACNNLIPLIAEGRIGSLYFAPFIKVQKNSLILPSGLAIRYPNLRRVGEEWVYDVFRKKYEAEATKLYGGKMVENICQGLAGELCKEAIQRAEGDGLHCVGQVHDEILALAEEKDESYAAGLLKWAMEKSPIWMPNLRLKAEVGTGGNWNEAKS